MEKSSSLAILILAAGSSSRLGEPKQLVKYQEHSLLYHSSINALKLKNDVHVVLGSNYEECKDQIENLNVNIIKNENYKDGLSSSIKAGISKLQNYEKVLIMLCDQPFIDENHFLNLIQRSQEIPKIVCSFYKNDVAVPAIFSKEYYPQLLNLAGDKGAKKIIKTNPYEKVLLDNKFAVDIDIQDDKKYLS